MNPEFYEDEVIEGFYVPSMMKKAWGAQMDVLNETDIICRRHDIPYFADWGSLIATIRHNGYIPWDDDLDISMRRKDYERFLHYAETELPDGFKVMNFHNHPYHHFFVARIVGKPRVCFEEDHLKRFHGFPYIVGVDLFVMDNACADREKEKLKSKMAEFVLTVADDIADGKAKGQAAEALLKECERYTGRKISRRLKGEELRISMYGIVEELFASIPDEESDALVQMMPFGMYDHHLYIPKEYYRKTIRIPYMDMSIPVPICYDAVTRMKFGNYMKIYKKGGVHEYPFYYGQHEGLLKCLDFEYPAYKACADDITGDCERSPGVKSHAKEYFDLLYEKARALRPGSVDEANDMQQTAIEFGTYIESVYGEGFVTVGILEELCELVYKTGSGEDVSEGISKCLERLNESINEDILERKDVVIIPFAAKYWKYLEKIHTVYKNDPAYNVHVVPIPYYYLEYDGQFTEEVFDVDVYPSDIRVSDYRSFDLKGMHPEKIVIQNPFDEWNTVMSVPKEYYSKNIRKFTDELIYIPFFVTYDFTKEDIKEYTNMDAYVCMPGVINADRIILPSETLKGTYIEKIKEFIGCCDESLSEVLDKKIDVRPELVCSEDEDAAYVTEPKGKKTILFCFSITLLAEKGRAAVDKIERTLDVFEENSDRIRIIWVSQNCTDDLALIDKDVADDFREAAERFKRAGIGEYLEYSSRGGNRDLAGRCDAYYGVPSAIALEFMYEKKPVMLMNTDV